MLLGSADVKDFGMSWVELLPPAVRKKAKKALHDAG